MCIIDGCENSVAAKGLCSKHYSRLRAHGNTSIVKLRGGSEPTHGMTGTRLYYTWRSIKKGRDNYNTTCCDAWKESFEIFRDWALANGYTDKLVIDRIDNSNRHYSPDNCRFVTQKENCNNKSDNRIVYYNGKAKTISEWADTSSVAYRVVYSRLCGGWSIGKALTTPVRESRPFITYNGKTKTIAGWAKSQDIPYNTLNMRLSRGWSAEKALTRHVRRKKVV